MNITLKLSQIVTNPNQPRKHFNEESLQELAASIVSDGLQEAILVRPLGSQYEIIQGERRYRASQMAGLDTIAVKVKELSDEEAFHLSVIENIQREQMTPIEEAHAFYEYVQRGYTHDQIAKKVSKNRAFVTSRLRLLKLLPFIHDWIAEGYISDGHAKQLLKMESFLNRLLKNKPTSKFTHEDGSQKEESHFENYQLKFHSSFWEKHDIKKEKLTVNEVKNWVDDWHYGLIISPILNYKRLGSMVVSKNRGFVLTAQMDCIINHLHISNITEEDIDFAVVYDLEKNKDDFDSEFRPWMVEKFWDDIRNELFHSDINIEEKWNLNRFQDELKKCENYSDSLEDKSLETLAEEIKFYKQQLDHIAKENNLSTDEIIDDFLNME
ncbi:ParB/RepB/Spo0J family partition protein [Paenibacillus polymyxa]|uniref:ParB/RepB/Spo0J family partition protein n=1 Tax=Paenibacillus polymyxa TaxID=1406 RepID=UPI00202599AA|nr:ParB/RepB/Spo0J family partition protein [Paenibacillus polymyxa]URJ59007.3 ParB/RepB/Spo0J family partition protein [Paenibacillus polymyxa]